jgi:transposase-like protein
VQRRRRWRAEEKRAMVEEAEHSGLRIIMKIILTRA